MLLILLEGVCVWSRQCDVLLNVFSSFAIILLRKRTAELICIFAFMWVSLSVFIVPLVRILIVKVVFPIARIHRGLHGVRNSRP